MSELVRAVLAQLLGDRIKLRLDALDGGGVVGHRHVQRMEMRFMKGVEEADAPLLAAIMGTR